MGRLSHEQVGRYDITSILKARVLEDMRSSNMRFFILGLA